MTASAINPFYTTRRSPVPTAHAVRVGRPVYARLPFAPRNASPVPHLTSLYHIHQRGGNDRGSSNAALGWRSEVQAGAEHRPARASWLAAKPRHGFAA